MEPYKLVEGKKVYAKKKYYGDSNKGMGVPYEFQYPDSKMKIKMELRDLARRKV